MIPKEPQDAVRGEPGAGIEVDLIPGEGRIFQLAADAGEIGGAQLLVGIDIEDPLATREGEPLIAGFREIAGPGEVEQPCAMRRRDLFAGVRGARIDDHDFVYKT